MLLSLKRLFLVILMFISALLAACSPVGNGVAQAPSGGSDPEIGAGREEVVSPSTGEVLEGEVGGGGPVSAEDGGNAQSTPGLLDWLTYTDPNNAFTLQYPSTYVVLPAGAGKSYPSLDREVYFQESGAAEFDPPALGVRVFPNPGSLPAVEWLVNENFITPDSVMEWSNIDMDGVSGVSNCSTQDIAPTCYRYFPFKGQIYELSPNGGNALDMLDSFRFLK